MLHSVLLIIHFICAFAIVGLVLLQRGKGADAGAGFGAGASGTVFGARGATTALSRATAILAGVFMLTSLSLTYVGTHHAAASSSLLEQLSKQPAPPAPAPAAPGATPGANDPNAIGAPAAPNAGAAPSAGAPPAGATPAGSPPPNK